MRGCAHFWPADDRPNPPLTCPLPNGRWHGREWRRTSAPLPNASKMSTNVHEWRGSEFSAQINNWPRPEMEAAAVSGVNRQQELAGSSQCPFSDRMATADGLWSQMGLLNGQKVKTGVQKQDATRKLEDSQKSHFCCFFL